MLFLFLLILAIIDYFGLTPLRTWFNWIGSLNNVDGTPHPIIAFIANSWFISIVTGIGSGILVTVISRYFFATKENREYDQNIQAVNREILYTLRACVPEANLPDRKIIQALISSMSRKYNVNEGDVYQLDAIGQELIKEVMDISFISQEQKQQYCNNILEFMSESARRVLNFPKVHHSLQQLQTRTD